MFDLFGEIPVLLHEVDTWLIVVARIQPDNWRARHYLDHWNVPDKIRRWKAAHGVPIFNAEDYEDTLR